MLFARVVHSVGVSKYGYHTSQARESPLDAGATYKAFFILGRWRSANEYIAMLTSYPLSQCEVLVLIQPAKF